jgi:hypothetical protein
MSVTATQLPARRRDNRPLGLAMVAAAVGAVGLLVGTLPGRGVEVPAATSRTASAPPLTGFDNLREGSSEQKQESIQAAEDPKTSGDPVAAQRAKEVSELLRVAEKSIRSRRYDDAIATLNRAGPIDPQHAPTYLNMGHALAGKGDYAQARRYYEAAINFDPLYADAYFAHAAASEQLNDLETALSGMRSFLHVVKNPDPYRLQVARARSAIWEWEAQLGRGKWGKTGGIPPGFTAAELRRDGRGMGTKMPIPGSEGPDGMSRYEIKTSDKFNLFKP